MPTKPLEKATSPTGPRPSDVPAAARGAGAVPCQPEVVLLVEDHEMVRATTAETLVELGYRVVEARSAEEAVRLLEGGEHVDLMVTDLVMPGLGGADLAAWARSCRPGLPVLLVSGHSDPEDVPADLPCLTKPYSRSALAERLAALRSPAQDLVAEATIA